MSKVVVLSGSPSGTSRLDGLLKHTISYLEKGGMHATLLRVRDLPPEDLLYARFDSDAIVQANATVAWADAVIVATPVYKASYTGVLKAYIDLLPQKGFENKIMLPLAMGGTLAHQLSIDYAIKPLMAALGATRILTGMFVLDSQVSWNGHGDLEMQDEVAARHVKTMDQLLTAIQNGTA
ncbi:NADPH-dependent FMN reductase [Paenibacillaceae bacterium WGS1546]|uniref:NADPH-dependent FMN reductase n=1 Tax=Cohnella sp. WGS1546 TaxID=3366810 RepID=UPI00372CFC9E